VVANGPTKIVLILEYDGTNYYGFQLQARHPEQPTIQSELEKAIYRLTGEEVRVLAASRTDTGVHARGQVVSFRTQSSLPTRNFVSGMNYYLPEDIAVMSAWQVGDDFDVRSDAVSREYSYYIMNRPTRSALQHRYTYLVPVSLDVEGMNRASRELIGEHDLASFTGELGAR
jgi:tRNA pseudouridine38-40 synthase